MTTERAVLPAESISWGDREEDIWPSTVDRHGDTDQINHLIMCD